MYDKKQILLINSIGLPQFETMDELCEITRLSSKLLYCLSKNSKKYYKKKTILKRNGSPREISIPSYTLSIVQKWILLNILDKITPSESAMAFRKGQNYGHKQNAFYHAHTLYGLTIDLKDFFSNIPANKVYSVFSNIGYNNFASTILTNLCTLENSLPQGAPTSPALSNLVCLSLDRRLLGLCKKRGIRYTRYADDMYFSCDDKILLKKIFPIVKNIIEEEGFILNKRKTHFHTPANKKIITGVTVSYLDKNEEYELKASKKLKKLIRAEIYQCIISGNYDKKEHIIGEIEYVEYIEKENERTYLDKIKKYIDDLSETITIYPELVNAYNANKFFKDSKNVVCKEVIINEEDDIYLIEQELSSRQEYLKKYGLSDICKYENLPLFIKSM